MKNANSAMLMAIFTCLCLISFSNVVQAQEYPNRPIRLIVPFTAGGITDIVARIFANELTRRISQQVVIDNRGGAASLIGTEIASRAAPDGYTLLLTNLSALSTVNSLPRSPVSIDRDLIEVGVVAENPYVICASQKGAIKSLQEIRQSSNEVSIGFLEGTLGRFATIELQRLLNPKLQPVPFRNTASLQEGFQKGPIHLIVLPNPMASSLVGVAGGNCLAILANTTIPGSLTPSARAANLSIDVVDRLYLLAPSSVPKQILERLARDVLSVKGSPDYFRRINERGLLVASSEPAQEQSLRRDLLRIGSSAQTTGGNAPTCPSGEKWCEKQKKCIGNTDTCQ